jgi:hypothetical protein
MPIDVDGAVENGASCRSEAQGLVAKCRRKQLASAVRGLDITRHDTVIVIGGHSGVNRRLMKLAAPLVNAEKVHHWTEWWRSSRAQECLAVGPLLEVIHATRLNPATFYLLSPSM